MPFFVTARSSPTVRPTSTLNPIPIRETGKVVGISDGDTISVLVNGQTVKIRLTGIDTPETVDPRKPVQCFGKEASARLKKLLDGKTVYLEKDTIGDSIDRYGRWLRYVYLGDQNINLTMIQEGYAYAYITYPFSKKDSFVKAQEEARIAGRGLWATGACDAKASPSVAKRTQANIIQSQKENWLIIFLKWML